MSALVRLRIGAFVRSGRAIAPILGGLAAIALAYGGGAAPAAEAYGFTAVVMFPVIAWQTKLLLDVEPDVQRRLARVTVRSAGREWAAGLAAAVIVGVVAVAVAMALPWLIGGIRAPADGSLGLAILIGVWTHLLSLVPAVALGALASRAITRTAGRGVLLLAAGAVLAIVLGRSTSPVPWLAPPLLPVARVAATLSVGPGPAAVLTTWAAAWAAVALGLYAYLRRTRA